MTHTLPLLLALMVLPAVQHADLVFVNGKIWTVDPDTPVVTAVAIRSDTIAAVGDDAAIQPLIGKATKVIDLQKRLMLPGFIDDHTHFVDGGFQLEGVDLRDARTEEEFAERIGKRAGAHPERWILGGNWDHDNWPGGNLPTKKLIDKVAPSTPVFVSRYDGHMAVANSVVLERAGVTRDTPDPPGGTIVRDPRTGEATGVLKDEAMSYVWRIVPDPTQAEILDATRRALREARMYGVTSIQDITFDSHLEAYKILRKRGELTTRIYCRLPIAEAENLIRSGTRVGSGDLWIKTGSLKAFADGSLGSSTALFFEPFTSDSTTHGLASDIVLDGRLARWAAEADKAGMQLSVHAIGDSANSLILDLFEDIVRKNPPWDRRFRIEHAQHIAPKDFERFARLGVIASVQPYHAIDDGRWAESRIGHERCKTTYAFRTFLDHGVRLCFGSDWTVAPLNPLLGIYAAVTRRTIDGKNPDGWFPEQKISVAEAVQAYTINNAFAAFEENEKGSITKGKLADLVVLSKDIFTIDPVDIEHVAVDMTVVGGSVVYRRP